AVRELARDGARAHERARVARLGERARRHPQLPLVHAALPAHGAPGVPERLRAPRERRRRLLARRDPDGVGRAWLYLEATAGMGHLGIDDDMLMTLVMDEDLLSEIQRLRDAEGCPAP